MTGEDLSSTFDTLEEKLLCLCFSVKVSTHFVSVGDNIKSWGFSFCLCLNCCLGEKIFFAFFFDIVEIVTSFRCQFANLINSFLEVSS